MITLGKTLFLVCILLMVFNDEIAFADVCSDNYSRGLERLFCRTAGSYRPDIRNALINDKKKGYNFRRRHCRQLFNDSKFCSWWISWWILNFKREWIEFQKRMDILNFWVKILMKLNDILDSVFLGRWWNLSSSQLNMSPLLTTVQTWYSWVFLKTKPQYFY